MTEFEIEQLKIQEVYYSEKLEIYKQHKEFVLNLIKYKLDNTRINLDMASGVESFFDGMLESVHKQMTRRDNNRARARDKEPEFAW